MKYEKVEESIREKMESLGCISDTIEDMKKKIKERGTGESKEESEEMLQLLERGYTPTMLVSSIE